ncbi:hypothetical protein GQ457_06G024610 [Hibiscus cannabinus]
MAELHHKCHEHPLAFNEDTSSPSDTTYDCAGCTENVSGSSYSCGECRFYLHKICAEAPSEIHHPAHRPHPLLLLLPAWGHEKSEVHCSFCSDQVKGFIYGCSSCEFYLDLNCALLPHYTSAGEFIEFIHADHEHPFISINPIASGLCNGCIGPINTDDHAPYLCFECRTRSSYHKRCLEAPSTISHPCHRTHQLLLVFKHSNEDFPVCNLCQTNIVYGSYYHCVPCKFYIHLGCAWPPPPIIQDEHHHDHPFTLLLRSNNPFFCDACGDRGNHLSYICSTCNIQVHRDCISLPRHIRLTLHPHPISHCFFVRTDRHDSRDWDCKICYKKVNIDYGSYYCSRPGCDFVVHVECSVKNVGNKRFYCVVEVENPDEFEEPDLLSDESTSSIIRVLKKINIGDDVIAAEIKHASHEHNLIFSDEIKDNKYCNGCVLPILTSFYYCSHCDFFLHKICAEMRRVCRLWFKRKPCSLLTDGIFLCYFCGNVGSGFCYILCDIRRLCLRCALLSHSFTYEADEPHFIFFSRNNKEKCSACAKDFVSFDKIYRCKDCAFALHLRCVTLPRTAWHKCDQHTLTLAYQDADDYSLRHYCDICEEERDPQQWFYHCETCDKAMHIKCVLRKDPFIKAGIQATTTLTIALAVQKRCRARATAAGSAGFTSTRNVRRPPPRFITLLTPTTLFFFSQLGNIRKVKFIAAFAPTSAGKSVETLHAAHPHPLVSINPTGDYDCFGCIQPMKIDDPSYSCLECGDVFHKKCLEAPSRISHPCHRTHQLLLVIDPLEAFGEGFPNCNLCQASIMYGFLYRCLPCNFYVHFRCPCPPPPIIEDKSHHDHPFTLLLRPDKPFDCDSCGNQGTHVSYICSTCNIQVHKDCISLPRHIRVNHHPHPISHYFFACIDPQDSRSWDCRICYKKVNIEYGSYYCSRQGCDFAIHVKCSLKDVLYDVVEVENPDQLDEFDLLSDEYTTAISVIREIKVGNDVIAAEITHISHEHNLILSDEIKDNKYCNGCVLPILSSFYYCSLCDFFLHKACAEMRKMCKLWFHAKPVSLTNGIFRCNCCRHVGSGFFYEYNFGRLCLRCASLPQGFTYQADKPHTIFYVFNYKGKCSACGGDFPRFDEKYRCKDCAFALHMRCVSLPRTAWHKCDQHILSLTYQNRDDYPLRYYCDICEEERDPQQWFYHCETCDKAMHIKCVLGKYPFIRAGTKYTYDGHPHPLTFVRKIYYYPECVHCHEPCQDLALECVEHECRYTVHWCCIKLYVSDSDNDNDNDNDFDTNSEIWA